MIPGKYNIVCPQGATLIQELDYSIDGVAVNLSGYIARMHVRNTIASDTYIIALTTENGRITLGGSAGTITLYIPADVTETLSPREYVYDLELAAPSAYVYRIMQGKFIVTPEVTR